MPEPSAVHASSASRPHRTAGDDNAGVAPLHSADSRPRIAREIPIMTEADSLPPVRTARGKTSAAANVVPREIPVRIAASKQGSLQNRKQNV